MESNGKRVTLDGAPVDGATGPVVWGEPGTNGQHAFYQLIHQGTDVVPCDFMVAAERPRARLGDHHDAAARQLPRPVRGADARPTTAEARAEMSGEGPGAALERSRRTRSSPATGPRTRSSIDRLDPATLGRLVALYEHKVFVEGVIWGINSFDQWGVELGKELATALLPLVEGKADGAGQGRLDRRPPRPDREPPGISRRPSCRGPQTRWQRPSGLTSSRARGFVPWAPVVHPL